MSDERTRTGVAGDPPARTNARINRARLIEVAREVFVEHGVQASLRDVARRAGVGIGTLYRHFPDRDALLHAVVGDGLAGVRASAEELMTAEPPGEAVITWLERLVVAITAYRGLPASVLAAVHDSRSPLHAACRDMTAAADALMVRAQQAGVLRTELTITDLYALAAGVALASEQVPDQPDLARRLLGLCADGLLVR